MEKIILFFQTNFGLAVFGVSCSFVGFLFNQFIHWKKPYDQDIETYKKIKKLIEPSNTSRDIMRFLQEHSFGDSFPAIYSHLISSIKENITYHSHQYYFLNKKIDKTKEKLFTDWIALDSAIIEKAHHNGTHCEINKYYKSGHGTPEEMHIDISTLDSLAGAVVKSYNDFIFVCKKSFAKKI